MIKSISLILFFIVFSSFFGITGQTCAQTIKIDSLQRLTKSLTGADKADALNKLALELFQYNQDAFVAAATEAFDLSEKLHYDKGKAEALIYIAYRDFNEGKISLSIKNLKESIRLAVKIKDTRIEGYGLRQLGRTHQDIDQLDSALYYFNLSYDVLKDSLNPTYLARLYSSMADYNELTYQYDRQLKYLNKSMLIYKLLHDRDQVWVSVKIASHYTDRSEYEKAVAYLDTAQLNLGSDTIQNVVISSINAHRAIVYFKTGQYSKALNLFYTAKIFYEQELFKKELTNLLLNIGLAFDSMGNYEACLKNYFEAMTIAEANHFTLEQTKLNHSIGWAYYRLKQFDLSEQYAQKAILFSKKNNHAVEQATSFNLMGLVLNEKGKQTEAFAYLNKALVIRQNLNDELRVAATLFNIGIVYEKLAEFHKSLNYQLQSLAIQEKEDNQQGMAYSYHRLGVLLFKLNDFEKAKEYLDKSEHIAKEIKARYILVSVYEAQRDLLEAGSKFPQSLLYTRRYENLKDSLFNEGLSSRISVLEIMYQLRDKEQRIKLLNQQKEIQQSNIEVQRSQILQQRIVIFFTVLILASVMIVTFVIFRYYKKVKSLNWDITERNEEIQAQTEELTEANVALTKLNREINEQKEEILAQSEELIGSNQIISNLNQSLEERIELRTAELKQAYKELDIFFYRSSHDFRRPLTTFMGLAEVAKITVKDNVALELFEKVNETARSLDKMLFKLQSISDVGTLELIYKEICLKDLFEMELNSFKEVLKSNQIRTNILITLHKPFYSYHSLIRIIIQNLIENAINFCKPAVANIELLSFEKDNEIVIEVRDNGQGIELQYQDRVFDMYFRANEGSKGNGLGLYIVKKTVQKLNGRVELESTLGEGTTVRVYLPNNLI